MDDGGGARLVTFVLAIVAAVIVGNHTESFWYGLLTWFIAMAVGRVAGALVRKLPRRALYKAIWPVAATVFALLFDALGLPPWANFFVSFIAASLTKRRSARVFPAAALDSHRRVAPVRPRRAAALAGRSARTGSRSVCSRCWSMTRSQPARSYSRSRVGDLVDGADDRSLPDIPSQVSKSSLRGTRS